MYTDCELVIYAVQLGAGGEVVALAPSTHPVTQVGLNIVLSVYKRINVNGPLVHAKI